jgi:hypothetical protein
MEPSRNLSNVTSYGLSGKKTYGIAYNVKENFLFRAKSPKAIFSSKSAHMLPSVIWANYAFWVN